MPQKQTHIPVLLEQVIACLNPQASDSYLDLTAGYGGHSTAILERIGSRGQATLVDRDQAAIRQLEKLYGRDGRTMIVHDDFLSAGRTLAGGGQRFDMILADLGVSSLHLDIAQRGFSLQKAGPLDMRMDTRQLETAADIINSAPKTRLVNIFREYGEVRGASRLANVIVDQRPIRSTTELAELLARASPGYHKVHPATKVFQALRIAVNRELEQLESSLPVWVELLKPGGRLVIISFHSLEDRLVKQFLQERGGSSYDAEVRILTRRPLTASHTEIVHNPRARSAKLRAAVKIKT